MGQSIQYVSESERTYIVSLSINNIMMLQLTLLTVLAVATADVSHIIDPELRVPYSTEPPPAKPYAFSYTAGRFPGDVDRQHTEVSDGSGVIRGQYSYVDPRHKIRTVQYVADKQGFHPVLSDQPPEHPAETDAVIRARDRHYQLYNKIAEDHAQHPHPDVLDSYVPRQSEAVALATAKHADLFRVIAEQHARIAAEREVLQKEEEEQKHLQELTK